MIEAFANHFSSHLGRHLFYWAIESSSATSGNYGLNLRLSELINKFHGPLERGVQVLDHLLTLEEDDFAGHWGSAYAHNYEPEYAARVPENEELPPPEHSELKTVLVLFRYRNTRE
ncbi:GD19150 [Drosophila simulans]|uniref:GD19150 n=1 Tax=Drosophila simulans TaxID=7240 RepID=B4QVS2_DROSI|nr:GD19150 [Drosophila simulans]